jgi:hypothetical protein
LSLTEFSGANDPYITDIRIRPAHNWFWTPLLNSESYGVHVTLKWRNDDTLDVNLDFGCLVHMTQPLDRVGPIHVAYHFAYNDPMLDLDLAGSGPTDRSACKGVRASG